MHFIMHLHIPTSVTMLSKTFMLFPQIPINGYLYTTKYVNSHEDLLTHNMLHLEIE